MTVNSFIIAADLPVPEIVSPRNIIVSSQPLSFYWANNAFDENFTYTLEISDDNFISTVFKVEGLQENSYTLYEKDYKLGDKDYKWHVKMVYFTCSGEYCTPIDFNMMNCSNLTNPSEITLNDWCSDNKSTLSFTVQPEHSYNIYIDTDNSINVDSATYVGNITYPNNTISINTLSTGTYYWKIVTHLKSCEGDIIVSDPFDIISVIYPSNLNTNSILCSGNPATVSFDTNTDYSYDIYYDTVVNSDTSGATFVGNISAPNNTISTNSITTSGIYYWKIIAKYNGCTSNTSVSSAFQVLKLIDPNNLSINGDICAGETQTLTFNTTAGYSYEVYYDTNNNLDISGATFISTITAPSNSISTNSISTSGTYYWKIIAKYNGCSSNISVSSAFNVLEYINVSNLTTKGDICAGETQTLTFNTTASHSYEVYYDTDGAADINGATLVGTVISPNNNISINNLTTEQNYYFKVRAHTGTCYGDWIVSNSFYVDGWIQATSNAPWNKRNDHSSVVFDNKIWVLGGYVDGTYYNDVWYSSDGANWTLATLHAPWGERFEHRSLVFDNKMWIFGGDGIGTILYNDVWYSTDGVNWTQATSNAPWAKRGHQSMLVFDNKMWLLGGHPNGSMIYNDVWYSTNGSTWTCATSIAPWVPRNEHSSVVYDNKMWVLGGIGYPTDGLIFNDVWYSSNGVNWTQATSSAPWSKRAGHTSVIFDNKIWVLSGQPSGSGIRNVWYSSDGTNWTDASDYVCWGNRSYHTSVVFDNKMWVIGGNTLYADVWYYEK